MVKTNSSQSFRILHESDSHVKPKSLLEGSEDHNESFENKY